MADPTAQPDQPTPQICPWCSTQVTADTAICPTCGAVLKGDEDTILPGVTAVDDKVLRGETAKPPQRSRLLSWISGDYEEPEGAKADPAAIAPPDPEVQREIRRLELEAEVANLQAEADALRAEARAEGRLPEATAEDAAAAEEVVSDLDAVSAELDTIDKQLDTDSLVEVIGTPPDLETAADPGTTATKPD